MHSSLLVAVLPSLVDRLPLGALVRLLHALGVRAPEEVLTKDAVCALAKRMGLFGGQYTLRSLTDKAAGATWRCVECGGATRCTAHVCAACAADPAGFRAMMSRQDARAWNLAQPVHVRAGRMARIFQALPIAKRARSGAHLYWRREVIAALRAVG